MPFGGSGFYKRDSMRTNQTASKNIDEYTAGFLDEVQKILEK
jgi:hypothetical protein